VCDWLGLVWKVNILTMGRYLRLGLGLRMMCLTQTINDGAQEDFVSFCFASVFGVEDDEGDYDVAIDDNDDEVNEKLLDAVKVELPR
jgi:hypothetical protein